MQGSVKKEWLIKSAGEIKGPYTFDEVVQGIVSKEFILVDEISRHFNRWKYLRDEEAFERAILEYQNKEYAKGEKTFTNSGTDTLTEEIRNNVVNFSQGDILTSVQEHLKENEQVRTHQQQAPQENTEVRNYAAEADIRREASRQTSSFKVVLVVLVLAVVGGYFFLGKKERTLSYDDITKLAYLNLNQGEFSAAKSFLQKALSVNSTNEEIKYLLSVASVESDDTVTAQRLLNEVTQSTQDPKLKSQSFNLLGVIQLKNFSLADSLSKFDQALGVNPKYSAAYYNKGVTLYLDNKFDQAHENFTQSLIHGGLNGNILLAMTEWASRQASDLAFNGPRRRQVGDILNLLVRQSSSMYNYRQEMKVAIAYIYFMLGEAAEMKKYIDEALNVDPSLTSDHVVDVSYYRGLVTWDKLSEWIKKMNDNHSSLDNLKTLYGYSLFKGSEKLKGKDMIEGLLSSNYSNVSNQIIHSYILMSLRRDDDAKATLDPIMPRNNKSLAHLMMGKICFNKKDWGCAESNFNEAHKSEKGNIAAMAGLAAVHFEKQNYKGAQDLVNAVLTSSPTYKPALQVKYKLEQAKKNP